VTAALKRRLARLEAAISPRDPWSLPWRRVILEPGDPEPEGRPGENLIIRRIVDWSAPEQ